jgi:hypothetical protein
MPLSTYSRTCAKNAPGNKARLFIAPIRDVTSITATSVVSAITMRVSTAGKQFREIKADYDTVQFTSEGAGGSNYFETQNLIAKFSTLSADLIELKDELAAALPCGFALMRVDNNGKAFISGITTVAKEGKERPWNKATFNYDSGTLPTDEGTQALTMTLTRMSAYSETPLNAALTALIAKNSASAPVDYAT